jgi:hypothetical protein
LLSRFSTVSVRRPPQSNSAAASAPSSDHRFRLSRLTGVPTDRTKFAYADGPPTGPAWSAWRGGLPLVSRYAGDPTTGWSFDRPAGAFVHGPAGFSAGKRQNGAQGPAMEAERAPTTDAHAYTSRGDTPTSGGAPSSEAQLCMRGGTGRSSPVPRRQGASLNKEAVGVLCPQIQPSGSTRTMCPRRGGRRTRG